MSNELGLPTIDSKHIEKSIEQTWREEALLLAVDANIGYTGLETFIKGYIAGRRVSDTIDAIVNAMTDRELKIKSYVDKVPINELRIKNNDGTVSKTITIGESNE